MSLCPLVSLCPSVYVTRLHLYHLTYLLQPCSILTPPPAYHSHLVLCMVFTWYLHMTIPLHPNQYTHIIGPFDDLCFSLLFSPFSFSFQFNLFFILILSLVQLH